MSKEKESLMKSESENEPSAPNLNEVVQVCSPEAPPPSYSECVINSQPGFINNRVENSNSYYVPPNNGVNGYSRGYNSGNDEPVDCCDCTTREGQRDCLNCMNCCIGCCQILLICCDIAAHDRN